MHLFGPVARAVIGRQWLAAMVIAGAICAPALAKNRQMAPATAAQTAGHVFYVDAAAADDNGSGSAASPKKHLSSGAALLSPAGGDTLIVKAGTYGHAKDIIRNEGAGKPGAWNFIKAETEGSVRVTVPLDLGRTDHYLQLEGLTWDSRTTKGVTGRYVKIVRCTFKGGPMSGNAVNLDIGTNDATPGAQYILIEDSQFYGVGGRYGVMVYNADKVVLRRLVVRHEPGWSDTKGDPEAAVALYNSTNVLTQNLLVVDSAGGPRFESAIYHPSNSRRSANIRNVGAVVLNTAGSGVGWDDSATVTGMTLEHSAVIGSAGVGVFVNGGRKNVALKNVTIVRGKSHGTAAYGSNTASNFRISDSIVAGNAGEQFKNGISATNVSGTVPPWPMQPVAGTGANIVQRMGKTGTLWGEAGFDQPQPENLWPFPNEAAIRRSLCTDAGISTGFCAAATLTRYVWEQLGTPIPPGIYTPPPVTAVLSVATGSGGSVSSSPAGILCGSRCSASFTSGSTVTLTPTPAAGQVFSGWGGACSGTGACVVQIDGSAGISVSARFAPVVSPMQALTVSVAGSGSIAFSNGDACSANCSRSFNTGTVVTLSASPAPGYIFSGWGGACSGTGTCSVTLDAARTVSAVFNAVVGGGGKVYYVNAQALDDSGNGSAASPKKYLSSGATLLSAAGGDTLIVKPGTYSHAKDVIRIEGSGKPGAWNVIKAEVDGSVRITVPLQLGLVDHHLQLEGLSWDSLNSKDINGRYVKILRCGFKGGPMSDNTTNLSIGTNDATPGAQYVLVEDSYFYGVGGRYGVLVYNADKVVLRRLVVRHEPGWADTKGDPEAAVALYNSTDVLTQNLLVVDSAGGRTFEAAVYHPSNSRASANIRNVGAVVLNTAGSGVGWDDGATVTGMTLEHSAVIGSADVGVFVNGGRKNVALKNVTIAKGGGHGTAAYGSNSEANFSIADSIVAGNAGEQFKNGITATNVSGNVPPWPVQAVGSTGASILKRLGAPGTLWGEPGFDQPTTQDLWPWPQEARIRQSLCVDVGVGTGFCAAPSLTQYVWQALGTPMPALAARR